MLFFFPKIFVGYLMIILKGGRKKTIFGQYLFTRYLENFTEARLLM